jgi:alpha-glucoside transport system permease protein
VAGGAGEAAGPNIIKPAAKRDSLTAMLQRQSRRLPLHIVLILIAVIWSVPTIALLLSSFREPGDVVTSGWWNAITHPFDLTLANYEDVLTTRSMDRAFVNSLLITIPSTFFVVLVAAFAAYAFAWMQFPGRNALFIVMVGLLVVPLQMTLIPVLNLYTEVRDFKVPVIGGTPFDGDMPILGGRIFGTNSYIGIWMAHTAYGLPFAIYLLRNFFGSIPRDILESAYIDGASDAGIFFRLIIPLSMPAIAALTIFQFLWVWNDLLVSIILLGDPELAPMTLRISSLVSSFGTQYQLLTAAAFISMALPLVIFFALQRYFVQGILAGAVKG